MKFLPLILILALAGCKAPIQDVPPSPTVPMAFYHADLEVLPVMDTNTVTLSWTANGSNLTGANVYWGNTKGGSYPNELNYGAVTTAVVTLIYPDATAPLEWYFVVTSLMDTNESGYSNEAHWPAYAPIITGFHLAAQGLVKASGDLAHWQAFTNTDLNGVDLPYDSDRKFFSGTNATLKPILFYPQ